jgi:hypothetical protein
MATKKPAAKPPGKTDAPAGKPGFPGAAMPFAKGGGRKKKAGNAKPAAGGK